MPILDFEFIGGEPTDHLAQKLADSTGEIFGSAPGHTWVKIKFIPTNQYAESNVLFETGPVFVSVLLRQTPELVEKEKLSKKLCKVVGEITGRADENIHIIFLPEGFNSVAFGGNLVK